MADADVLPYDYVTYARQITSYLEAAKQKAANKKLSLDFAAAQAAAARFSNAAAQVHARQIAPSGDLAKFNRALRQTESDLLSEAGLPHRPWYRHTIFAPGEYTGYDAVVIPGVNEAIDSKDQQRVARQLAVLAQALTRAAQTLEAVR
jgi:N-acetylated-alpha-linked acidic dipeptidase